MKSKIQNASNSEQIGIVTRRVSDLTPYARNARTHSDAQVGQIAASIKEFGFNNPILVRDGQIVAGHGRWLAAQRLGMDEVPTMDLAHLTATQARAYVLADNQLALAAGWDAEMLALELIDLKAEGVDLDLLGFPDVEALLVRAEPAGLLPGVDEDAVPEPPKNAITKLGDVITLGRHRIVCGSATDRGAWESLDLARAVGVFTSPPYGAGNVAKLRDHYVKGAKKRDSFYVGHADAPDEWLDLMTGWTALAVELADCVVCNVQMLADNKRSMIEWAHTFKSQLVDVMVWDKVNGAPQMQSNVLTNVFEWAYIFAKVGAPASRALPLADFHGTIGNVIRIDPRKEKNESSEIHRAVMPTALAQWFIENIIPAADLVVDPFGGSGTTMIAAEKLGKASRLIELDPIYCDVIVARWEQATGQKAVRHAQT
jgi:hypothetical protein